MTKTPEQMAEDWLLGRWYAVHDPTISGESKVAFLAGYKAAQQWISVKERLPETNELCIVNTEWRGIVPATYGNESWIFDEGQGWSEKALSYASHWMPLPEPPEEEK